jgi:hypothetical protein
MASTYNVKLKDSSGNVYQPISNAMLSDSSGVWRIISGSFSGSLLFANVLNVGSNTSSYIFYQGYLKFTISYNVYNMFINAIILKEVSSSGTHAYNSSYTYDKYAYSSHVSGCSIYNDSSSKTSTIYVGLVNTYNNDKGTFYSVYSTANYFNFVYYGYATDY